MDEKFVNTRIQICIATYYETGLSGLNKGTKVHVSVIRNFGKRESTSIPCNLGFVRGPMGRRRRIWIFDKVCECSLKAL